MTLDKLQVSRIGIMGHSSHQDLADWALEEGLDLPLIDTALAHLGASKVVFTVDPTTPLGSLYLVSGSRVFTQAWSQQVPNSMLVLCDEHIRAKNRLFCQGTLRWMSLQHDTFGGVTHFQAMLGTNIPGFEPVRTTLQRTIWHVLQYSLKPKWSPAPTVETTAVTLSLDQRLHPTDLTRNVLYHTHYSATGWGKRSLSANEVGIAFGWPAWARKGSADLLAAFPSLPLQIMDGCLKGITSTAPR
jgi:hypothetical protein